MKTEAAAEAEAEAEGLRASLRELASSHPPKNYNMGREGNPRNAKQSKAKAKQS